MNGQSGWTKMANFPGVARRNVVSFTIGHYGFVGLGNNASTTYSDFYRWDQTTNIWSQIPDYPGGGNDAPIAFSINGKGYVGLGEDGTQQKYTNLFQYDTVTNSWTPKASFPSTARYSASAFSVGHKGYMVCGAGAGGYLDESWMYDANTDHWSQNATPFPGGKLEALCSFTIGEHGYVGCGWDQSVVHKAFWQYDTTSDAWTTIPDFPVSVGLTEVFNGFVIGSKGYVCSGLENVNLNKPLPYGYAFDTITKAWSQFTNMSATKIGHAFAAQFAIGNQGYLCSGQDSTGAAVHDFWQFGPLPVDCSTWTQMADFPGVARENTISFTIGHYAFVGLGNVGSTTYSDFYKWDQTTNGWSQIPDYPGGGNVTPVTFSINGKGYVGMGEDGAQAKYANLYQYDTLTNSWTPKAAFPSAGRYSAASFSVGHKGYMVCGASIAGYLSESWVYDANTDHWSQNSHAFPGGKLEELCAFAIGSHGYVGCGWDGSSTRKGFWSYDTTNDAWTAIPDLPVSIGITEVSHGFVIGSKGYVCSGLENVYSSSPLANGFAYDTLTKVWTKFTSMSSNKIEHSYSSVFAIGKYGYMCAGHDSTGSYVHDFWQFCPCQSSGIATSSNGVLAFGDNSLKMYPNPTSGILYIEGSLPENEKSRLIIFNNLGQLVYSKNIKSKNGPISFDLSELSNGIYSVILQSDTGIRVKRIVLVK
jgi:hypothetical protein